MFGISLILLGFSSSLYSGSYCKNDLEWRSSDLCVYIGVFTVISSQTSVNLLVFLTAFRLKITLKPFDSASLNLKHLKAAVLYSWASSVLFAVTPLISDEHFTKYYLIKQNNFFQDNVVDKNALEKYMVNTENINFAVNNIPKSNYYGWYSLSSWYFASKDEKYFQDSRQVNLIQPFTFYSSSSVCFPDFYSHANPEAAYSLAIVLYNLIAFIFICIAYIIIFRSIKQSSKAFKNTVKTNQKDKSDKARSAMFKTILMIVTSDALCWFPIITLSIASYAGLLVPGIIQPLSAIVFLPINSLINPVINSRLDKDILKVLKKLKGKTKSIKSSTSQSSLRTKNTSVSK